MFIYIDILHVCVLVQEVK